MSGRVPRARGLVAGALAGVALVVAGCTSDAGTPQLRDVGDAGFVAGDGSVAVLPAADRGNPVDIAGESLDGEVLDLADHRGGAVVLNVWGSWCAPCRAEAPDLVSAHDRLTADHPGEVAFVGLNIRDASATNARRFEESFAVPYPSLYDPDSLLLLELRGEIPPNAIPSTLVLDRSGAVAARVLGRVDEATLVGLVEDVLAESPGSSGSSSRPAPEPSPEGSP